MENASISGAHINKREFVEFVSEAWDESVTFSGSNNFTPQCDVYLVGKLLLEKRLQQGLVAGPLALLKLEMLGAPTTSGLSAQGGLMKLSYIQ